MLSLALLTSLMAAEPAPSPAAAAAPLKVLVLDLRADTVPPATASLIRDEITVDLGRDERLDVLSTEDLRRVVSVEAQKEAMGCDEASCLAEMGQALGARYIVHGSIGVLGTTTIVHLHLVDSDQGRAIARETIEARNLDDMLPNVRNAVGKIRERMLGPTAAASAPLSIGTMVGVGAGVAGAAGLVVGIAMMSLAWPTFASTEKSGAERLDAQNLGQAGTVVAAVGGVVGAAGAGAFLLLE